MRSGPKFVIDHSFLYDLRVLLTELFDVGESVEFDTTD